jgi:hypothetical protein
MKSIAAGLIGFLALAYATAPVSYAQSGAAEIAVVPRVEDGNQIFEIVGRGFPSDTTVYVRAANRRTQEGVTLRAHSTPTGDFRGVFLGRDADGRYYVVAPGIWGVRAKAGAVTAKASFRSDNRLREGRYGSEQALLVIRTTDAEFEFPCASGRTVEPLLVDQDGNFDVAAELTENRGPVQYPDRPARMTGNVQGNTVTFSVTAAADDRFPEAAYGPAEVRFNREPTFERCT